MNYAVLGLIWGVIKYVLKTDLVNTALDHWTAGTSNKIDDWVWKIVEEVIAMPEKERPAAIVAKVEAIQARYDMAKVSGVLDPLKEEAKQWDEQAVMYAMNKWADLDTSNIG